MHDDRYQYVLEMTREDTGAPLGRVPIAVDWEPLRQSVAMELVRTGDCANFSSVPAIAVEPEPGQGPFIQGVRIVVHSSEAEYEPLRVGIDYFRPTARAASEDLVKRGQLKQGDLFKYGVLALPKAANGVKRKPLVIREAANALSLVTAPLAPLMRQSLCVGSSHADDFPVIIDWQVLQQAALRTRQAGEMETGGILVGHLRRDPAREEIFIEITAQVPARAQAGHTKLSFTPETWSEVDAAVKSVDGTLLWLGWWHSHPFHAKTGKSADGDAEGKEAITHAGNPFLSADDIHLHRTVFARPYCVALLITDDLTDQGMSWTVFGWRNGAIVPRNYHVIRAPLTEAFLTPGEEDHGTIR